LETTEAERGVPVVPGPSPQEVVHPEERFQTGTVLTAAVGHFTHDLYPSFIATLMPLLIEKYGLTLSMAGALATVNRWPSLLMPVLGNVADRYDARAFVIWGPTATALAITTLGLAPNIVVLVALLLVAGFTSSAFHPAASALATAGSGRNWGRGSSFFMTGGELSRSVGPPLIVAVVSLVSLEGAWIAAVPAFGYSLYAHRFLKAHGAQIKRRAQPTGLMAAMRARRGPLLTLAGVVTFRSLVIAAFQAFFAVYLTGLGETLFYAGMALAIYEAGGTVGAFVGGPISDRFGRRTVMAFSQLVAGPMLFGALVWGATPLGLAVLFVGGLLALSASPVQLALAQELLPENRSAASGIMMFLAFEGNVAATLAIGFVADAFGLQSALTWSVFLSMLSLPFTYLLPETRHSGIRAGH
jgi:FSR family fosmidomycin resistance protein-like MFS transporter